MTKEEILRKLICDLEVRNRSKATISEYVYRVRRFQNYYDKPADEMGETEISEYQHYLLTEQKLAPGSVNIHNTAMRFLYGVTLNRTLNLKLIPRAKQIRSLPQLFTKEEIRKIIDSATNVTHRAMFMLAYGSGLRASEIRNLKVTDIESDAMRIFIRKGKGGRDRYVLLPQTTLEALREHWKKYRPKDWLFEAPIAGGQYQERTLGDAFRAALEKSGVEKKGTLHTFRHCFATHIHENGADLLAMKKLLGHVRIDTTAWYTQLSDPEVFKLKSPIDSLPKKRGRKKKQVSEDA